RRYLATVTAQGDPGYAATTVMLGEAALCLALDGDRLPAAAGVLTPATALGDVLADRLRGRDFTLRVEEIPGT
ncbi:MAG: enoyl-ACP reductase, partial [Pedococcus sp.]